MPADDGVNIGEKRQADAQKEKYFESIRELRDFVSLSKATLHHHLQLLWVCRSTTANLFDSINQKKVVGYAVFSVFVISVSIPSEAITSNWAFELRITPWHRPAF